MIIFSILFWIVIGICVLCLGYAILINSFLFAFLFVDCRLRTMRDPVMYPPIAMSTFVRNYVVELWYQLGKFYLYPLRFFKLNVDQPQHKYAILLVHGYDRDQTDWLWMRKQLRNVPVFLVNLHPSFASIETITSDSIPAKIQQIRSQTGCDKIILIGHSMGGLVASYYSEFLDHDHVVAAVITIGSPFHGTTVSVAGFGANAREMCPGSNFLNTLRHKIQHTHKNYYQIASQFDNLIFPWESALLQELPEDHKLIVKLIPHLTMLHRQEIAQQLNAWVAELAAAH